MSRESYSTPDNGFVTISEKPDRVDVYAGDRDSGEKHCHGYADARTGDSGVVHRGGCDECRDDNDSSGDNSSGK